MWFSLIATSGVLAYLTWSTLCVIRAFILCGTIRRSGAVSL
ncbi:hypothetical protein [Glaciimonas sp. GG7]